MLAFETLAAIALCTLAWCLFKATIGNPMRRIPGPRGVPVLGNTLSIDWPTFHLQLTEWKAKYGSVMRVSVLGGDVVVISSLEAAREALVNRGNDFSDRPPMHRAETLSFYKGISCSAFTPATSERRNIMQLHLKDVSNGSGLMGKEIAEFLSHIGNYKGQPFDARIESLSFFCNIIATKLYGEQHAYDHPVVREFMQLTEATLTHLSPTSPGKELDVFPWLKYTGLCRKGLENLRAYESLRDKIILDRLKQEKASFNPSSTRGIFDELISYGYASAGRTAQVTWDDEQIRAYVAELIVGGSITSTVVLQSAFIILLNQPELQVKIQEEIDKVIGVSEPSLKHRSQMPYTEAFILELLRYFTVTTLMLPHYTTKDTSVGGYFIPASTRVLINSWCIHHNEDVYVQPFTFRPERFLNELGQLHSHDHPTRSNFMIFGLGRRACPGESSALAEQYLLIVSLLQRHKLLPDISRPPPNADPRGYKQSLGLAVPDCLVRAVPRD